MENGIPLRSAPHPRPPLWWRLWGYVWRPTIHESSIASIELEVRPEAFLAPVPYFRSGSESSKKGGGLKIVPVATPTNLVGKLYYIGNMKPGDPFPSWMTEIHPNWGVAMSRICKAAAERIEQLEQQPKA